MEISKKHIVEMVIAFIILVMIFELFDNERLLVLDLLSLGTLNILFITQIDFHVSLVIFGLLTPITLVNLANSMWTQRMPVDKRDHIRVGTLFLLFIFQYAITNLNDGEQEFMWKISKAVCFGSMTYIVLGEKKKNRKI